MSSNIIDIRSCQGEKYERYKNVADHVSETLEEDKYVLEDRFREDMLKLSMMMCECASGDREKKWCRVSDILKPERDNETRSGFSTESFSEGPDKPSGKYKGGYEQRAVGKKY